MGDKSGLMQAIESVAGKMEERQDEIEIELWDWLMDKQDQGFPELFLIGLMERVKASVLEVVEE